MGVQIRGQVEQTGVLGELVVEDWIMVPADIVGDVAVKDVG